MYKIIKMSAIDYNSPFWQHKTALTDSRQVRLAEQCIFFALKGLLQDGHQYLSELYQKGVRHFVVSQKPNFEDFPDAEFVISVNPLITLQEWASTHRKKFDIPVLGITGSNGKTIIKEWLYQLLHQDFFTVKSPKSYNSQLGVPLSVLQMQSTHTLAIFEAGISQDGEMEKLGKIISPKIGIFTNIGPAHDEGFRNREEKISEKLKLFTHCETLIYCSDYSLLHKVVQSNSDCRKLAWGFDNNAEISIRILNKISNATLVSIDYNANLCEIELPFSNSAAIENALHCVILMLHLNYNASEITSRLKLLKQTVAMRLEWKAGNNQCMLIDDTYNNDLSGLRIALDFMEQKHQQSGPSTKSLILSDIPQTGIDPQKLYATVAAWLRDYGIQRLIAVGPEFSSVKDLFSFIPQAYFYSDTSELIYHIENGLNFNRETILIKGARKFEFERIVRRLRKRTHSTVLELDLNALLHNFNIYRKQLNSGTKIMVMVKAFAYGSSSYEVARLLQYHQVDYLGVAYTDEGINLRKKGIKVPIMVMSAAVDSFEELLKYDLHPSVYSLAYLHQLVEKLQKLNIQKPLKVHIELDSGMHRLGFDPTEIQELSICLLRYSDLIEPLAIYSHLAAADEAEQDKFTKEQITVFDSFAMELEAKLGQSLIKHILNSAGISRFLTAQCDMVRLGIGLHGIDPNGALSSQLIPVATLKTLITQIRTVESGSAVGYGRHSQKNYDRKIATLSIGYADGLMRASGNQNAHVFVKGKRCPLVGNICMDMCFADVSDAEAEEGDEVIIFGPEHPIELLADALHTIPYEILTHISGRVPRIFFEA